MNTKNILTFLALGLVVMTGCKNANSYSEQLKAEKKLIAEYIEREQLNILKEEPDTNYVWGEKDFYQVAGYDNLYFHLRKRGEAFSIQDGDTVWNHEAIATETIVMRYKKFTLGVPADTSSFWTTLDSPYPVEFKYRTDFTNAPTAWHEAVRLMRYSESECQIICPSKLGFEADGNTVTPYGYILKMRIKN